MLGVIWMTRIFVVGSKTIETGFVPSSMGRYQLHCRSRLYARDGVGQWLLAWKGKQCRHRKQWNIRWSVRSFRNEKVKAEIVSSFIIFENKKTGNWKESNKEEYVTQKVRGQGKENKIIVIAQCTVAIL